MPTAIINQPHVRVHLVSERLQVHGHNEVTDREEVLREIPLHDLERLVVSETVHFTAPALGEILRRGIPIQIFSWRGQFLANIASSWRWRSASRPG